MACRPVCSICKRLAISTAMAFDGGNLVIALPAATYQDGEKVCLVIAQAIPADTTITAPVVIQIGDGAELYPLVTKCCQQVTACGVRTRTRYSTIVVTSATGATFRMLGSPACSPNYDLQSIDGTAPAEATSGTSSTKKKGGA